MASFLSWYILITVIGWMTFPLIFHLFPALKERGYTFARAFGLMLWGYLFWMLGSLGMAQNDMGGLLLCLVIVGGLSAWSFTKHRSEILEWIGENRALMFTTELLFVIAFGLFAYFRAANPEIVGTEKPMELMFINGVMNSPMFPPRDPWLSGYAISYYYFGYVMTGMLGLFTNIPATMAFNLMISLVFGLSALGAYGIIYNLQPADKDRKPSVFGSLLGPLFLLLISNLEGFLEVLHARGFFWNDGQNFWTWLDIPDLRDAPSLAGGWISERYWWWWRASRVLQDYDFMGNHLETIDEFPAFSFLLGDLHPHVLAIPFFLIALSVALNLFMGGFRGKIDFNFAQLHISKTGFILSAFMLGALAFLNTWDILPGAALIVFSYVLARVREAGWGRERTEDAVLFGLPLIVTAYVLFLPFFIGFDSQAGGIVPNFMYITRGAHLWVMWGALFIPIFAFIIYLLANRTPADWRKGIGFVALILGVLVAMMIVLGFLVYKLRPEIAVPVIEGQGLDALGFLNASFSRRLLHIGSLLTLLALLIPVFSLLFAKHGEEDGSVSQQTEGNIFSLLLIALGGLLILGPDFLYLQDNFGYRINTVFKFYYQAWLLLSIASAYGTIVLLKNLRRFANVIFTILFALVLIAGLAYPVFGFPTKANDFNPPFGFTLDDFDRVQRENPEEAAAILWLKSAPDGIILEATGNPYSSVGRISAYTGLQTVLGWGNHEGQWHGSDFQGLLAQRKTDIETIYVVPDWQTTQFLLDQYEIRYVLVGGLERNAYRVNEEKFNNFLRIVFQQGGITIYEVPR